MPALANAKHEAVLQAYLADPQRVGWRAYKAVYKKSSQRAAETGWSRLLKDAVFSARRDELVGEVTERAVTSAVMDLEEVLTELSKLGRSSIKNVIVRGDDTGDVIAAIEDMPDDYAATIKSLTVETYMEGAGDNAREVKKVKLELHDKKGALSELRRHHEPQKVELGGKNGEPIETKDVTERPTELEIGRRIAFALEKAARLMEAPKAAAPPKKRKAKEAE